MLIDDKQLKTKPKKVGKLGKHDVMMYSTKGGLVVLSTAKDGKLNEIIGMGPHRAIAYMTAQQRKPEIEITALSKSEMGDPTYNERILPQYLQMVEDANKLVK